MTINFDSRLSRSTFVLALVALSAGPAHAQSAAFKPRVDFGMAQSNAQQTALSDFDHDGNLDIAVTMEGASGGKVEVLFGDGQSDFGSTFEFNSYVAWGLCNADFDADGWDDLAVTAYGWASHMVRIVLNDHNGGFAGGSTVSTLASPPVALAAGDFDSDGVLDLAAASETGGYAVDWFKGFGNGNFSSFHYVPNTTGLHATRIYTGHFNADAHLDLVFTHTHGAMVLLNDSFGTGNFNASAGTGFNESLLSLAVVDIDNDGTDDLLTGSASGDLRVWHGQGDGSFVLGNSYASTVAPRDVRIGDIDNNGHLDVLLVGTNGVELWFGQGGGNFGAHQSLVTGVVPKSAVLGDWNGDGWLDIAVACQNYAGMDSYLSVHEQIPPPASAYCSAKFNSVGCLPWLEWSGQPSASAGSGFLITATQVLNNKSGVCLYGTNGAQSTPFQGGTLCVNTPIKRIALAHSGGNPPPNDCSGSFVVDFNAFVALGSNPALVAGAQVNAQIWHRDPGFVAPNNTGLTDGLQFVLGP